MTKENPPTKAGEKSRPEAERNHQLESEIERRIGEIVPQRQRQEVVQRVLQFVRSEYFSGPIPPPRHLQQYDEISPGSANRIISMAEKAQEHNISMEAKLVAAEISDQKLGMWLGFAALVVLVILAFWAGMTGNNILSGMLLTSATLGVVISFIRGRNAT